MIEFDSMRMLTISIRIMYLIIIYGTAINVLCGPTARKLPVYYVVHGADSIN